MGNKGKRIFATNARPSSSPLTVTSSKESPPPPLQNALDGDSENMDLCRRNIIFFHTLDS